MSLSATSSTTVSAEASRGNPLALAFDTFGLWRDRIRTREHLSLLSEHYLQDVGLSRRDVEAAFQKPFWKA